jgi:vancomycin resistance protein YoaR
MFKLAMGILIAGSFAHIGCSSPAKKEDAAQEKMQEAHSDMAVAKSENQQQALQQTSTGTEMASTSYQTMTPEQKKIQSDEWKIFKAKCEADIAANNAKILELKVKMKKPGKTWDDVYAKKIDKLEARNNALAVKINTYDPEKSNWEAFKREFNHDMEEIGSAFKDLTVNNEK